MGVLDRRSKVTHSAVLTVILGSTGRLALFDESADEFARFCSTLEPNTDAIWDPLEARDELERSRQQRRDEEESIVVDKVN